MRHAANSFFFRLKTLTAHGIDTDALYRGQAQSGLRALDTDLRAAALQHLNAARDILHGMDRHCSIAFLPLALVKPYLRALVSQEKTRLTQVADINPLKRVWVLWWARRTGRF